MIRSAKSTEHQVLTEISFASKGQWGYPKDYFDIWRDELTITPEYIEENSVYIIENNGVVIGYYSIVELKKDIEISGIIFPTGNFSYGEH